MKTIGLFFGTFDPIYIGHEKIAKYFLEKYFDQVWFVITPLNPDKVNENLTDENIRFEMTKKYCVIHKDFEVCDIEYKLPKPNYTADTLVELKKNYRDFNFSIIMGEDNLIGLENWKNYKKILEEKLYVYPRNTKKPANSTLKSHKAVIFSNAPLMEVSSSEIRNIIRKNKNYSHLIPDEIYKFISDSNLYN